MNLRCDEDMMFETTHLKNNQGKVMCKRDQFVTYMSVSALDNNAVPSFPLEITIAVGHFLY